MLMKETDKPFIHQGFATQYAKELRSMSFALIDDAVYLLHRKLLAPSFAYPATTARQIAGLSDRNHVEGRKEWLTPLLPLLKVVHIPQVWPAEIPAELPKQLQRGLSEHSPTYFY